MLESLLELALLKKDKIQKKLDDLYAEGPDTSKRWVEYDFKETREKVTLSAGDGSINKKKFLSFVFYAISAETLIFNQGISRDDKSQHDTSNNLKKIESSDIDVMPHHKFVEDRLRNHMSLFELKNALKSIEEFDIDYYLFDGSILGNLIRPIPMDKELETKIKDKIKAKYSSDLLSKLNLLNERNSSKETNSSKELNLSNVEISSSNFQESISKNFENKTEAMIYLESLENLMVISKLLQQGRKIVGISKTSTSNEEFGMEIPDMALFDSNSSQQGYSKPTYPKVSKKVKRDFPVENEFFRSLTFTIFYARLEDNKNLLKFELPYRAEEDEIINLLNIIKSNCVEGYPYLLKKAHNDVVIKKLDMERLLKMIGLEDKQMTESKWRGMLDE